MKYSVIIPVYNAEPFLDSCLRSLLNAGRSDAEIILIDDGSADRSAEICRKYASEHRSVIFQSQKNSGPAAARNRGISLASGDYLLFVDSDDSVTDDYFEVLDRSCADNPDMLFFGSIHTNAQKKENLTFPVFSRIGREAAIPILADNFSSGDLCSCTNKAFARSLFADGSLKFPEGTVVEEDLIFVLRAIARAGTFSSVSDGIYNYYRRTSGSVTTAYNPIKFDCKISAYKEEKAWAVQNGSERFGGIFDDNLLSYVSASVNNLMYRACPMKKAEKLAEIRRFFEDDNVLRCAVSDGSFSGRSRVMALLIRKKMIRATYVIHKIVSLIRGR